MKSQCLQSRDASARENFERVFVRLVCQDDAEARDVFAEDFDDRPLEPALAEAYARRKPRACSGLERASAECWNSASHVSCHKRLPSHRGELTAAASQVSKAFRAAPCVA
jgi:hypothetical protein